MDIKDSDLWYYKAVVFYLKKNCFLFLSQNKKRIILGFVEEKSGQAHIGTETHG